MKRVIFMQNFKLKKGNGSDENQKICRTDRDDKKLYCELDFMMRPDDFRDFKREIKNHSDHGTTLSRFLYAALGIFIIAGSIFTRWLTTVDYNIYCSPRLIRLMLAIGIIVLFISIFDRAVVEVIIRKNLRFFRRSGAASMVCNFRLYEDRIEFVSVREHSIYYASDVQKAYQSKKGIMFLMYSGEARFIPAGYLQGKSADSIVEDMADVFLEKFSFYDELIAQENYPPLPPHGFPVVEKSEALDGFGYSCKNKSSRIFDGIEAIVKMNFVKNIAYLAISLIVVYIILILWDKVLLSAILLFLDILFFSMEVVIIVDDLKTVKKRISDFDGRFEYRFFKKHMTVITKKCVVKLGYGEICGVKEKKDCVVIKTTALFPLRRLELPDGSDLMLDLDILTDRN